VILVVVFDLLVQVVSGREAVGLMGVLKKCAGMVFHHRGNTDVDVGEIGGSGITGMGVKGEPLPLMGHGRHHPQMIDPLSGGNGFSQCLSTLVGVIVGCLVGGCQRLFCGRLLFLWSVLVTDARL